MLTQPHTHPPLPVVPHHPSISPPSLPSYTTPPHSQAHNMASLPRHVVSVSLNSTLHFFSAPLSDLPPTLLLLDDDEPCWSWPPSLRRAASAARLEKASYRESTV
jgi:hypothetical protein